MTDAFPPGYHSPTANLMTEQEAGEAIDRIHEEVSADYKAAFPTLPNDKTERQLLEEILAEQKRMNEILERLVNANG